MPVTTLRTALKDKAYQAALTVNLGTGWAIFGIRSSLIPLFVVEALHRGTVWVGLGLLVGAITDVILLQKTGKLADSWGRRPMLIGGTALGASGALLLAFAPHLPAYLIAMAIIGAASSMLSVGPSAVVGDVVQGRGGTVVSSFGMASDLGAVIGPLAAGALAEHVGYGAAFTSTAIVLLLGLAMALRMPETVHRAAERKAAAGGGFSRGHTAGRRGGPRRPRCRRTAAPDLTAPQVPSPATEACVIRPGCSISDSTPPRDSPSVNSFARSQTARASDSPPTTRKEIIPPKSRICLAAISCPGCSGRPG